MLILSILLITTCCFALFYFTKYYSLLRGLDNTIHQLRNAVSITKSSISALQDYYPLLVEISHQYQAQKSPPSTAFISRQHLSLLTKAMENIGISTNRIIDFTNKLENLVH
ncbi:MAG: hypothetical protein QM752_00250 [Gammaproteobacteria bacterium]